MLPEHMFIPVSTSVMSKNDSWLNKTKAPCGDFGFTYTERINLERGAGEALRALLRWLEASARRWGKSGLAAWLR